MRQIRNSRSKPIEHLSPAEVKTDYLKLRQEHRDLQQQYEKLLRENDVLKRENIGSRAERYVERLTAGRLLRNGGCCDVFSASQELLEVKGSSCGFMDEGSSPARRWKWGNLFGTSGGKRYDYIVLLGEKDPNFLGRYYPGEFVIFCATKAQVTLYADKGGGLGCPTSLRGNVAELMVKPQSIIDRFSIKRGA